MGHGGFWVQETIGAQHHGLDLQLCAHTHTHTHTQVDTNIFLKRIIPVY